MSRLRKARRVTGAAMIDGILYGLSTGARYLPVSHPRVWDVAVEPNLSYAPDNGLSREHTFDLYRPRKHPPPWPVVLYVHGGGFHTLSKDSHWMMGIAFASRGYLVYNINYRLAPRHRFPAALEDVCRAYRFVLGDAPARGGDTSRLVVTGESAGGNLVTALTACACWERPEPFARAVFDTGVVPNAVVPACGILQTTDTDRFRRDPKMPGWIIDYVSLCAEHYLGDTDPPTRDETLLADPLLIYERSGAPDRPLPPFFVPVGTRDPLLRDSRRLHEAVLARGGRSEVRYYKGGVHAFHAFVLERQARRCWRDKFEFLHEVLQPG